VTSLSVLLLSDLYPPVMGGLELHVEGLARELATRGHHVTVATQPAPGTPARAESDGVTVHRVEGWSRVLSRTYVDPRYRFLPPAPDPGLVRELKGLIDEVQPDVVHAHGWILYSAAAALLRRRRPALVVTLHDYSLVCAKKTLMRDGHRCPGPTLRDCLTCAPEQYGVPKAAALVTSLRASRRLHRRVDRFLAVSGSVREASRLALQGRPIDVVPNFLNRAALDRSVDQPRPDFLPPDDGFVLYVGALAEHKGVDVLVEAQQRFAGDAELVLVGPPAGVEVQSRPGLTVVPGASRDDVMRSWIRASVGVVPSVCEEACPTTALEAMASGLPLVASRVGGVPELVPDGEVGLLVPPGDPAALGDAIGRLLHDDVLRGRLGEAALERSASYAARPVVDRIETVYREVAA
jgi:glycosyltransferase involved in cell wall biosynthesis